jgi:hypothetical protein
LLLWTSADVLTSSNHQPIHHGIRLGRRTAGRKLNKTSFHAWKHKIPLLLALIDLDEHIEEDPSKRDADEFATWRRRDKKAMACIGLSLSNALLDNVREASSAKEMWTSTINLFERHTLLDKLSARRNFYTTTMLDGEKIL